MGFEPDFPQIPWDHFPAPASWGTLEAEALVGRPEALAPSVNRTAAPEGVFRRGYDATLRLAHLITGSTEAAAAAVQESFVRLCPHALRK